VLCVESTKLRYGPDLQTCGDRFLANCHFLKSPLIYIPVCITESTVAASTPYYEWGGDLSWTMDKTDK